MARSAILNVMVNAAIKAGKSLTKDFNEVENLQVSIRSSSSPSRLPWSAPTRLSPR
jgi:hypothetical protein